MEEDNNQGGFWVPEVAYIDEPTKGWIGSAIRSIGSKIARFGIWITRLGYTQREIHPHESLKKWVKEIKSVRE